jgi:hypothetical protein
VEYVMSWPESRRATIAGRVAEGGFRGAEEEEETEAANRRASCGLQYPPLLSSAAAAAAARVLASKSVLERRWRASRLTRSQVQSSVAEGQRVIGEAIGMEAATG